MGIQKLEGAVVRAIGASQVLTDPASLVKELIDNALDAHATYIAVEISSNTLDVVQVRDNGHGILPEDRAVAARPNTTSKLVDIESLRQLGGSSLGFRGQALASAAEMSGTLTISTRVEGEQVASVLRINKQGEVIGQERASLPVGTTVRITDFIPGQPVRRQVALKTAEKCLKKIKQTLRAYAFARPSVRLSLRVSKAKNDRVNWIYAPKPGGNTEDAAFKIVGAACASQCTWSMVEQRNFSLQAFLPREDADLSKICNFGSFISVDGRPVTAARGTLKEIVKIFRGALRATSPAFDGVKEPFIYLAIECPPVSYDPNIEPGKDDVLFEEPENVIKAARQLFTTVYPAKQAPQASSMEQTHGARVSPPAPTLGEDDLVIPIESKRVRKQEHMTDLPSLIPPSVNALETSAEHDPPARSRRVLRPNMYGCDEEDLDLLDARTPTEGTEEDIEELQQARKDVQASNPWVMAKLNAPVKRQQPVADNYDHAFSSAVDLVSSPAQQKQPLLDIEAPGLPTPHPSSPLLLASQSHISTHMPGTMHAKNGRLIGPHSLPAPAVYVPTPVSPHKEVNETFENMQPRQLPPFDRTLQSPLQGQEAGTPLHAIPQAGLKPRRSPRRQFQQGEINAAFVSPLKGQPPRGNVWFDHLEDKDRTHGNGRRSRQPRDSSGLVFRGELGDLVEAARPLTPPRSNRDIREFIGSATSLIETRNYGQPGHSKSVDDENVTPATVDPKTGSTKGTIGRRVFVPASEVADIEANIGARNTATRRTPKRRNTSNLRILGEVSGNAGGHQEEDDAEYQLVGKERTLFHRRRTTDGKVHRTKSSRLPLEHVPASQGMHNVSVSLSTSLPSVSMLACKIDEEPSVLSWNKPSIGAYNAFGARPVEADLQLMTASLYELLISRVSDGEVMQDLGLLVQRAFSNKSDEGRLGVYADATSVA